MLAINGMPDHVHIFIGYDTKNPIPDLVKSIKIASNEWINDQRLTNVRFAWQEGYGAFSYSRSQVHQVCTYIENQEIHHAGTSFKNEYLSFLKRFDVAYDEKYLFEFFDDGCSTPTESVKTNG